MGTLLLQARVGVHVAINPPLIQFWYLLTMVTVALNQNEMFIMEVLQKGRGGCPGRKVKVCGCLGGRGV